MTKGIIELSVKKTNDQLALFMILNILSTKEDHAYI